MVVGVTGDPSTSEKREEERPTQSVNFNESGDETANHSSPQQQPALKEE